MVYQWQPEKPEEEPRDTELGLLTSGQSQDCYSSILVKPTTYLQRNCFAVSFLNMTKHVESLKLESQVLEERNRTESLESFTSTISHEYRTPLGTSLMFLESVLESDSLSEEQRGLLNLVVCQLNLLLCLVNDMLDIKLIKSDQFTKKVALFKPADTLNFIAQIFHP